MFNNIENLPVLNIDPNTATMDELLQARNTILKALDSRLLKSAEIVNNIKEIITSNNSSETKVPASSVIPSSHNIQVINIYSGGAYHFDSLGNYIGSSVNNIIVTDNLISDEICSYEGIIDEVTNYGQIKWIVAVKNLILKTTKVYIYFEDEKVVFNILRQRIELKYSVSKCSKLSLLLADTK